MKVVDASAIVDLLAGMPRSARVRQALGTDSLSAPELIDVEVLSACARLARAGIISWDHANLAVDRLRTLPLDRIGHDHLTARAWTLRGRAQLTDAFYVACAELLDAPLVTCDGRLTRAPLPGVSILLVQ